VVEGRNGTGRIIRKGDRKKPERKKSYDIGRSPILSYGTVF
jgi:hypothetical protein